MAANVLMLVFLVGGLVQAFHIRQEVFPEFEIEEVVVRVGYPGASPAEVERGLVLPLEEALNGLAGVAGIESVAREGAAEVRVEPVHGLDIQQLATDIKNEVDRITSFPEEAEEPTVIVPVRRRSVITLVLYGDISLAALREYAEQARDMLLQDPDILQVDLTGTGPPELTVELRQETLRTLGLTIEEIGRRIQAASLDLAGGTIRTPSGQIQVQVSELRRTAAKLADLPIPVPGGSPVHLADLASIREGFAETDEYLSYNGRPAIGLEVYRVGDQTPIGVARAVERNMENIATVLPEAVHLATVDDRSLVYRQRLELLLKNGWLGLLLVFALLGCFLDLRLAFWVTLGIPVSFLGALLFLPWFDVSVNMVSLFAFIVSLGIVVDDTIIIGENVYSLRRQGYSFLQAARTGVARMAVPVTCSVLTNVITFLPLYFVPGVMGKIFRCIPVVVTAVFLVSLLEALLVLPAHLAHQKQGGRLSGCGLRWQRWISCLVHRVIQRLFLPPLRLFLRYRYLSVSLALGLLLLTAGFVASGQMGITLFPRAESDKAYVTVSLPAGSDVDRSLEVRDRLLAAADRVREQFGGDRLVQGMLARVQGNRVRIRVYLQPAGIRPISTGEFVTHWRRQAGRIQGIESIRFKSNFGGPGSGPALDVELHHRETDTLRLASARLAAFLERFPEVSDIDDGFSGGQPRFSLQLKPVAWELGLTPESLGRQLRYSYYGYEVHRQIQSRSEVKILVRLSREERRSLHTFTGFMVRLGENVELPLDEVAVWTVEKSTPEIIRRDSRRLVSVTADVTPQSHADRIRGVLKEEILPRLQQEFPALHITFGGKHRDRRESLQALARGMILALIVVYGLLAVVFRSYLQPALIMTAIPFGIVGAVAGHLLMGYSLSLVSFFGIVALSGVVVNDSLVLIDLCNTNLAHGQTPYAAIVNAAASRFRPILLTTLTTFFGLLPMIFETSRQARFLIPMAISLGFGIVFATAVTLILIPCLFLILHDIAGTTTRLSAQDG